MELLEKRERLYDVGKPKLKMSREKMRPPKEKSNMIMQAGMASIPRARGRPRKDKTNIIMSTIEAEASEELEGSVDGHATRKSRRTAKERVSRQIFEEESMSESNEDGDYDDDCAPPAKKRGRRGSKPTRMNIAMASPSANRERTPIVIPPVPVEKNKRRVATTTAAEVEREVPEGIFDEFWDSEDEEDIVS
jgi:antitoxin component of MazEF toxin-antitoxin module